MSYGCESNSNMLPGMIKKSKDSFDENVYIILEAIIESTAHIFTHFTSLALHAAAHVENIKR